MASLILNEDYGMILEKTLLIILIALLKYQKMSKMINFFNFFTSFLRQKMFLKDLQTDKLSNPSVEMEQQTDSSHKPQKTSEKLKKKRISKAGLKFLARKALNKRKSSACSKTSSFRTMSLYEKSEEEKMNKITSNNNFIAFLLRQVEEICCPICRCEIIEPVNTPCGHLFCLKCMENSMLLSNRCPICREHLLETDKQGPGFSKGAQKIVQIINSKIEPQTHLENIEEYHNWKERRFVSAEDILTSRIEKVDILSSQGRWKKAKVLDYYSNQSGTLDEILIKYQDDLGASFSEVLEFDSLRVAKYGFYTNTKNNHFSFPILSFRRENIPLSTTIRTIPQQLTTRNIEDPVQRDYPGENFRPFIRGLSTNQEGMDFLFRPERVYRSLQPPSEMSFVESEILDDMSSSDNDQFLQNFQEES